MSDQAHDSKGDRRFGGPGWPTAALGIVVAVLLTALGTYAVTQGRDVALKLGDNTIEIARDESFAVVLDRAIEESRRDTDALLVARGYYPLEGDQLFSELEKRGYYHIGSQDLLSAIRRFDIEEFAENDEVAQASAARMRDELLNMMGSLEGPFRTPGTLRRASADFLLALDDLKAALEESEKASNFLTDLWLAMANRRGVFGLTTFATKVRVVGFDGSEHPRFYVCSDNDFLGNRHLQLRTDTEQGMKFTNEYQIVEHVGACFGNQPGLALALGGTPIPIAVNAAAAREMFGAESHFALPGREFAATASVQTGR